MRAGRARLITSVQIAGARGPATLIGGTVLIGKTAAVQVAGLLQAQNLPWVAHGKGSVKINGSASFVGTVLAPEHSVKLGQYIHVDGALLGNKVNIAGLSSITHLPFAPLL